MSIVEKQMAFATCLGHLLTYAAENGHMVTVGDAYRDPRVFGKMGGNTRKNYGSAYSQHKMRMACDLNLFALVDDNWKYVGDSALYAPLGHFWTTLHPDARWGGNWTQPDGAHFSFEHAKRQ